jgi:hypothetical protein
MTLSLDHNQAAAYKKAFESLKERTHWSFFILFKKRKWKICKIFEDRKIRI